MQDFYRKYYINEELAEPYILKEGTKEFKVYPFVLSTENLDRQFEKVKLKPDSIRNFKSNPKMFLNHDSRQLPIGEWKNIRIEDGRLLADAYFHNLDDESSLIESYVAAGQLKAASIGFQSLKRNTVEPDEKDLQIIKDNTWSGKVLIHEKIDILEASIVSIPANPEALSGKSFITDDQAKSINDIFLKNDGVIEMSEFQDANSPVNEIEVEEKAGAVLNKTNRDKLSKAKSLIDEVIESAGTSEDTGDTSKEFKEMIESLQAEIIDLKEMIELQSKQLANLKEIEINPVTVSNPKVTLTDFLRDYKKEK